MGSGGDLIYFLLSGQRDDTIPESNPLYAWGSLCVHLELCYAELELLWVWVVFVFSLNW